MKCHDTDQTAYPQVNGLAMTGMRKGEALSLRWHDIDLERATVSVRRNAGMVCYAGEGAEMVEDDTKSSKPRVVDLDADTVMVLRAWKAERGSMALPLAKPGALAFGTIEGQHRNGEHVSRQFLRETERCQAMLGTEAVPGIRLHNLRHTMATIMQVSGRTGACRLSAARPCERRGDDDGVRTRAPGQPARRRRPVRPPD